MVLPLDPEAAGLSQRVVAEGERGAREATAQGNVVAANYFQTMGIPLRSGRTFAPGDLRAERPGVILSAALARELFGETNAVGRELRIADTRSYPPYRVLGVVGDVYGARIQDGVVPMMYFPLVGDVPLAPADPAAPYQPPIPYNPTGMRFVVATDAATPALVPAVRRIVRESDPKVPVANVTTIEAMIAGATAQARLTMLLLSAAAAAALLLSAIGLYSVIAYAVAGRRRELGVRLALGATPKAIAALVVRDGLALVVLGVIIGIAMSLAASRVIRGALFDVSPTSPLIYSVGTMVVILVALASTYFPARNAARIDAARTLRTE